MSDVQGNLIYFSYGLDGALQSVGYPGSVTEQITYDAEGRTVRRSVKLSGGYPVIDDTLAYDPLGRVSWGQTYAAPARRYRSVWNYYAGVGALAGMEQAFSDGADPRREEFKSDALANRHYTEKRNFTTNTWDNPGRRKSEYDDFGRLTETYSATAAGLPDTLGYDEASMYVYDVGGNLRYRGYRLRGQGVGATDFQQEANYYQADGKLRVFERHMGDLYQHSNDGPAFTTRGVHEEYRYDALGRRVLVWARRGPLCTVEGCESTVQRFVWDGDQLVYETRGRGADSVSALEIETENPYGNGERQQPNAYGEVVYTHAGGIDRPLAVFRATLGLTFFPHANWRSLYDGATNVAGQLIPCKNGSGVPCSDSPDLDWPGSSTSAFIGATREPRITPAEWAGSLVTEQADASGLLYRRNRYYDPGSGRFTQPDPIGLAGGLNAYGFANGDPVTYSDPFGLCPIPPETCFQKLANWGARRGGVLGDIALNAGAAGAAALEVVGVNDVVKGVSALKAGDIGEGLLLVGSALPNPAGKGGKALSKVDDIIESLQGLGAKVKPHPTRTGQGAAVDFGDGTVIDVRVETHGGLHGNVQRWEKGKEVSNTHVRPEQ